MPEPAPGIYSPPTLPVVFPRSEWYDSEWWRIDTKWHKMAFAACVASNWWLGSMAVNERDDQLAPWVFRLAVFDRVNQINHQRRKVRRYGGAFGTVAAWQAEIDTLTRLVYDEAELAWPPDASRTYPDFEEVRSLVRILMDHDYLQGQDAEPEYAPTSDWDESEYVNSVNYDTMWDGDVIYTWPFSVAAADAKQDERPFLDIRWQHPARSVRPDEWEPWKYKLDRRQNMNGQQWIRKVEWILSYP